MRILIFFYHNELGKYIKVEGATSEDVFHYFFDVGLGKFLLEKGKKYLHASFKKWNSELLRLDEDFDDYLDNDGLEDITRDEVIQNLNMDD